jgi:short-subunit dehydrogenase
MKSLQNKIIWITGASSGIGEALAIECAKEGAKLVLTSRRAEELDRVAGLTGLPKDSVMILPADLTDFESIPGLVNQVIGHFGRIDVLFNNAGISSRALALESPIDIDKKVMDIDYFSVIALTKQVVPGMIERGEGHIVVTSSVMGKIGTPLRSAYSAAKHALHGFFESLRIEVIDYNIKITMLCPGYIHTQVSVNAVTSSGDKFNKMSHNQLNGKDPRKFARVVIKGIKKDKLEIHYGGKEIFGPVLYKFSQKLLNGYLHKQHKSNRFAD